MARRTATPIDPNDRTLVGAVGESLRRFAASWDAMAAQSREAATAAQPARQQAPASQQASPKQS